MQKPFAIILFVGEGLTSQRLASARLFNSGADTPLTIDSLPYIARLRNYSADFAVPDSAAAATALATGVKVKNGRLSPQGDHSPAATILELAHARGRSTGIITDGSLMNPTAAAFYAHGTMPTTIQPLVQAGAPDLALGGGKINAPSDNENLRVIHDLSELQTATMSGNQRIFGLFADDDFPFSNEVAARANTPSLADMVREAIILLQQNGRGYVLVVDAHLMGTAAQQNAGERTLRETIELDRAVSVALEYAGENSAIVVAGDVAIGGMNISGFPYRSDSGVAILGLNSFGQPWITWATGPKARPINPSLAPADTAEPAAVQASSALKTLDDPVASATGIRMERVNGTMESNALFTILRGAL